MTRREEYSYGKYGGLSAGTRGDYDQDLGYQRRVEHGGVGYGGYERRGYERFEGEHDSGGDNRRDERRRDGEATRRWNDSGRPAENRRSGPGFRRNDLEYPSDYPAEYPGRGEVAYFEPAPRHPSPYPDTGRFQDRSYSDDEICDALYDALDDHPGIPYEIDIHLEVAGGVATLTGNVPSRHIKIAAWNLAWQTPGIVDVFNNLKITGRRQRMRGTNVTAAAPASEPHNQRQNQEKEAGNV